MAQVSIPSNRDSTHLQVGVVARPHGIRGELKLRLHNEESDALTRVSHVLVEPVHGAAQLYEIESVRGNAKVPILALIGVDSCDQAETFRGAKLWIERTSLAPLEPGEYYLVDLVGCAVVLADVVIGRVQSVRPDPSVDTMVLLMNDGSSAEVAILDAWVGAVDINAKKVELLSEDGLIS